MKIYIESRVCEELGLHYNDPGTTYEVEMEKFIKEWDGFVRDPYYISINSTRKLFKDFRILFKGVLKLENKGSGYFEVK